MIPVLVEAHLREWYRGYDHHAHAPAATAEELAAAEHVSGDRVAKPVVVKLGDELAIAVVAATDRVDVKLLEEATGRSAHLAAEADFAERFRPCDVGAEPPFAMFGAPIFVDDKLVREERIIMPAGTHEDAVVLDANEWVWCERVQLVTNLGQRAHSRS